MKLFKKIISVLLSTSYMFTSIVFADGPKETPKTGTKKLEPYHLANVVQYMPMTEKIKLEQVNKTCADSLKMGYADKFLFCYDLLKNSTEEVPKISEFGNYNTIHQAFSSSGKLHVLTQDVTEIEDFKQKFSAFAFLVKSVNFFYNGKQISKYVVFLPRNYNITNEYNGSYTNDLPKLQKFEKWLFEKKYVLPEDNDIYTGKAVLCMQSYFDLDKKAIMESCPVSRVSELTDMYYMPVEERYLYYFEVAITYNSKPEQVKLHDLSLITPTDFAAVLKEYVYKRMTEIIRNGCHTPKEIASYETRCNALIEDLNKEMAEDWYKGGALIQKIKQFISDLGNPTTYNNILDDPATFNDATDQVPTCTVFCEFLPKDISCLTHFFLNTSRWNKNFFNVPWNNYNEFKRAFAKLDYYKKPANTIISTEPLINLPKFDEDMLFNNFLYQLKTACPVDLKACVCIAASDYNYSLFGLPQYSYDLFSEDKLKSTIYLLSKAKCSLKKFEKISKRILYSIKNNQTDETYRLAESILEDAKNLRGEFKDLASWSKKAASESKTPLTRSVNPTINRTASPEVTTQPSKTTTNSSFGTALVGVTGLSALGALVYNGINKYKNKPSNISKSKNNKNINKKIAKNIS